MTDSAVFHDSVTDDFRDAVAAVEIVKTVEADGGGQLSGDVTLSEGANITLTTVGNDIEIASTGSGGAPDTADYLVGTAQAGLSAEIVVGTAPGGELGGTWASPTVDAVHSGSSHAATQAAAEATAAAALSAHVTDPTDAHDATAISFSPAGTISATDVQAAIEEVAAEAGGGSGTAMSRSISQTGHGLAVADIVRFNGTDYVKAQADSAANAEVVGIVSAVADANTFTLHFGGRITGLSGLTAGTVYFLSAATAGLLTSTEPSASTDVSKPLLIADSTTTGYFFNYRGLIGGGASSASPAGMSRLVYRYTVTGSAKASIDTAVDAPEAGDNIWSGGDLLEIHFYCRTSEAVALSVVNLTFNNDTGSNYHQVRVRDLNTTVSGANTGGAPQANFPLVAAGASAAANVFATFNLVFPNYAGTVGYKAGWGADGVADGTAANMRTQFSEWTYLSTSAITRLKMIPATGGANLAVGSQLLIYKRTSS